MHMKYKTGLLVALLFMLLFATTAEAQSRKKRRSKKRTVTEYSLKDHLWYGTGFTLGFNQFFEGSRFAIGLSPMVGYKIVPAISVGPRVAYIYNRWNFRDLGGVNLSDVEAGGFLRAKVYRAIFLQGEISNQWIRFPEIVPTPGGVDLGSSTTQRANYYLGAGYNPGVGGFSTDIMLLFNLTLLNDPSRGFFNEPPYQFRFNLTFGY
jgi:hypothetical protein